MIVKEQKERPCHHLTPENFSSHSHLFQLFLNPEAFPPSSSSSSCSFSNPATLTMCSSMEDENPQPTKPHKLDSQVPAAHHANPSKLVNNFLFKATIFTVFLVILPLLPSILPEFINLNFHPRIWELLQLVCVGIAVSYGLFSKKNEGIVDKEAHNYSLFDNANSYISRLLQVSSVFEDEVEYPSSASSDENKLQSWSSQYYREEPIVMVANESPSLEEETATSLRIEEKPLLLPVRSLKSRVSESNAAESSLLNRSDSNNSSSNRFSGKSAKGDAIPPKMEEKTVHPSPIPWRSRSGRMEMKSDEDSPLMEDSETQFKRSRLSRSFKLNSTTSSSSPPTRSSRFSYNIASDSKGGEIVDDSLRRKIHYPISSPPPPPPPPPPPASFLLHNNKPLPLKSNSGLSQNNDFLEINLRNSSVKSVKTDSSQSQSGKANSGSGQRAKAQVNDIPLQGPIIRPKWKNMDEKVMAPAMQGPIFTEKRGSMDNKPMPEINKESLMEYPKEDKKGFNETVVVETDMGSESESESESEEDDFERSIGNSESAYDKEEEEEEEEEEKAPNDNGTTDEGPDVDKKADEFIAKFREQIRLQRTQSIRSSTTDHHSRNRSR